jgi:DNA-binding PadR family transcriptional regulator
MGLEYRISNPELAVLALASEGPRYGYQIDQIVSERGVRQWTELGFSSIYYLLKKLEERGLLSAATQEAGARPARRVYAITPSGLDLLRAETKRRLSAPRPHSGDLDLALSAMILLPIDEVLDCLRQQRAVLTQQHAAVAQKWQSDRQSPHYPWHVDELFGHSLSQMQAEIAWLEGCIARLETRSSSDGGSHA